MAYPQSYDELEPIDLNSCFIFSHILTDDIVDEFSSMVLGQTITFFVKYGSGTPISSIINPNADGYLLENITGVYSPLTTLWKFVISIPEAGTLTDDLNDIWKEMTTIIKIHSLESEIVLTRRVDLVNPLNKVATKQDVIDLSIKIDELIENENNQSKNIEYLSNGWKIVF